MDEQPLRIELGTDEQRMLHQGLASWGGPGRMTQELAQALGHESVADFHLFSRRVTAALSPQCELPPLDWTRALAAVEICFASDVFGAGYEWSIVTGMQDAESIAVLRGLQSKLVGVYSALVGTQLGTRPPRHA